MSDAVHTNAENVPPIPMEKLSKPAQRALTGAGFATLEQLAAVSEQEISRLHGMGPKGLRILREVLADHQLSFADARK